MSHPAEARIKDLIHLTRRMREWIEAETALLKDHRPQELAGRAEEKSRLIAAYTRDMAAAKKDAPSLKGAPKALLDALRKETGLFRAALKEHEGLLGRLRRVSEGLIKSIADEVARKRATQLGYTAAGAAPRIPVTTNAIALTSVV